MSSKKVQHDLYKNKPSIDLVQKSIQAAKKLSGRELDEIKLIAVSKKIEPNKILEIINLGQKDFGENRVQEALSKWPNIQKKFPHIKLHLIGPLQTNKVRDAVSIFDTIHSLDRLKLAEVLAKEFKKSNRRLKCFVQVNIGEETQKSGVLPAETDEFVKFCIRECKIPIIGLMCIPPANEDPAPFFAFLKEIARRNSLHDLSMGMSRDFETAISLGATQIRVGSAIFGPRNDMR
jgi:pyridoxal phosphate enzyme (YggS family)